MRKFSWFFLLPLTLTACSRDTKPELRKTEQAVTDCSGLPDGSPCDDGSPCTYSGECLSGSCHPGLPVPDGTACDDSNACTTGETCQSGGCGGGSYLPDGTPCDPGPGTCFSDPICIYGWCYGYDWMCDYLCAADRCRDMMSGNCVEGWVAPDGALCSDDNPCTGDDACSSGLCRGVSLADGTACNDNNQCTNPDGCVGGVCVGVPKSGQACSDGDACTSNDTCVGTLCSGVPIAEGGACDDSNTCTTGETCQSGGCTGGSYLPDGTPCDPGPGYCFSDPICIYGWCYGYDWMCDYLCAADRCRDTMSGNCVEGWVAPDGALCSDDNPCTGDDACSGGLCRGGSLADGTACNDNNQCTNPDGCVGGVCVGVPKNGQACNDGDACTGNDTCVGTLCSGTPIAEGGACDDSNACTTGETCQSGGCAGGSYLPDGTPCEPSAGTCFQDPICIYGWCYGYEWMCDYLCAADRCRDTMSGNCVEGWVAPDGALCSDDNPCTGGDACSGGLCRGVSLADGTGCSDGNSCTDGDACLGGACLGVPKNCSHLGDACNVGGCNLGNGACEKIPRPAGVGCGVCMKCDGLGTCLPAGDGEVCEDGQYCTVSDVCSGGVCAGQTRDCSGVADACNAGVCNEIANACVKQPANPGQACDDGRWCTVSDACSNGVCAGQTRDCSGVGDQCKRGVCNDDLDQCQAEPLSDGTACNDGQYCSVSDACSGGGCGGRPRDCSALSDGCNDGSCNEATDSCRATPKPDGTACDDGQFCTNPDVCSAGGCIGGARDCTGDGDACNTGVCNENANACQAAAKPDGTVCDDSRFCTVADLCKTGICQGASRDCSGMADACNNGTCNESQKACVKLPANEGQACDDRLFCTVADACAGGSCAGTPRNCSTMDDTCNRGACVEADRECIKQPANEGQACNDGLFCTVSERCASGVCTGAANPCADSEPCTEDGCDEVVDKCSHTLKPVPGAEGPPGSATCGDGADNDCDGKVDAADPNCQACASDPECDDGNPCTKDSCNLGAAQCDNQPAVDGTSCSSGRHCRVGESCASGVCAGGTARDCSQLNGPCSEGVCSETNQGCEAVAHPDGIACNDGQYCTVSDTCASGVCTGQNRDCSLAATQCSDGLCDEAGDACAARPMPDGTACEDGRWCTVADNCTSGNCVGVIRDCSSAGDSCHNGICSEGDDACLTTLKPDGTACEDGLFCTGSDRCSFGVCLGQERDCSEYSGPCTIGWCSEDVDKCQADSKPNGTVCDDGRYCTEMDTCVSGGCTGSARDCSQLDQACRMGSCNENSLACEAAPRPVGSSCSDGDPCNGEEACDGQGSCQDGQIPGCDDGDPCTADACRAGEGCVHNAITDFVPGDGCCPPGGSPALDDDCSGETNGGGCGCNLGGSPGQLGMGLLMLFALVSIRRVRR